MDDTHGLLGRLAVHKGWIQHAQLIEAVAEQGRFGNEAKKIGEVLVEKGYLTEAQVQELLRIQRAFVAQNKGAKPDGAKPASRPAPAPAPARPAAKPAADDDWRPGQDPFAAAQAARSGKPVATPVSQLQSKVPADGLELDWRPPSAEPKPEPAAIPEPEHDPFASGPSAPVDDPFAASGPSAPVDDPFGAEPSSPVAEAAGPPGFDDASPGGPPGFEFDSAPPAQPPGFESFDAFDPAPAVEVEPGPDPYAPVHTDPSLRVDAVAPPAPAPEPPKLRDAPNNSPKLDALLTAAARRSASDVHLHPGAPLAVRIHGSLVAEGPVATDASIRPILDEALTPLQRQILETEGQLDLAYAVPGVGRFRANIYEGHRGRNAVFRFIPSFIPSLAQLGLPSDLSRVTSFHQGMVLVTGPAGCGKSTTLAALVDLINEERQDHILTVEDPVEYLHTSKRCLVNQREVHRHTTSFARALRAALREDPDILVIGELRDLETISLAMTAAETGHLVLATLHTSNAITTINRLVGAFPPDEQGQIRTMLSESLRAVISQRLVPRADGRGRVAALEILKVDRAVANTIRENRTFQLRSTLQTGQKKGMLLLDNHLALLVQQGIVSREAALKDAEDPRLIPGGPRGPNGVNGG